MSQLLADYPNPVLMVGSDDYDAACCFSLRLIGDAIRIDNGDIVIPVSYDLQSALLNGLISDGTACPVAIVRSPATSYRRLRLLAKAGDVVEIRVPKYDVQDRIDVEGLIVANTPFKLNDAYGELNAEFFANLVFDLRKGDVLAKAEELTVFIDDSELEKPLSSIFSIVCSDDPSKPLYPIFDDDKIVIRFNRELFRLYNSLVEYNGGSLLKFVSAATILPVLTEAVAMVVEPDGAPREEFSEYRWWRSIEKKALALGINLSECKEPATYLADRLLGNIALDALKQFEATFEEEFNSGEEQGNGGVL